MYRILSRSINRRLGYNLADKWRAQTSLAEFHHCIPHLAIFGNERSDAYSALRITLRHRVNQHNILLDTLQVACRDIGRAGIDKLAIDLIGEEKQIILLDQIAYAIHLLTSIKIARRVIGITDKDSSRAFVNQGFKLLNLR